MAHCALGVGSRRAIAALQCLRRHCGGPAAWQRHHNSSSSGSSGSSSSSREELPPPTGPLVGIKVLDLGQVVAGGYAGGILAYFGADVIKVEPPGRGDALRHLRMSDASGTSLWWRSYGRNRRCITLDLRRKEGQDIVRRLANQSDVLVSNFTPGKMEEWGLGPADLDPSIVHVLISGYGQTGPLAKSPGYASVCEAFGGLRHINGYPDRPPVRANASLGDTLAGLHGAFGAVMALLHRDRTAPRGGAAGRGQGQVVDAAISESIFAMLEGCVPEYAMHGYDRPPSGSTLTGVPASGTWLAADGVYVVIGGNGNSVYDRLVARIGRPDLASANPEYASDAKRCDHEQQIAGLIEEWVAGRSSKEVLAAMAEARVPAGPILSTADIMAEPQYRERGMFQKATPPGGGQEVTLPAMLPVLGGTPGSTRWAGPELGEHTDEVLAGELGLSAAEIAALRECGAV